MEINKSFSLNGVDVNLSTGKLANLASGSVLLKMGGTTMLATVTVDNKDSEQDFLPLSIEYVEKMYARGAINGSRFQKRESLGGRIRERMERMAQNQSVQAYCQYRKPRYDWDDCFRCSRESFRRLYYKRHGF